MRNGEYWQKRMMALEAATHSSAAKAYKTAASALEDSGILLNKEIDKWIGRIAKNNGISVQEARKWLKGAELKEFQWDLETYIRKGEENAYSHKWVKELENASARAHISRLEAMELEIESILRDAYGVQYTVTGDLLTQVYQDRYYGAAYDIEIGTGNGTMLAGLSESAVRQVVSNPWSNDNVNFSSRIWSAMDDMKEELHKQLTRQILTGAAPDQAISAMTQYVDAGVKKAKYRAGRLVMTESAAIGNKAQQDCFAALGVKEYVIIATLDGKTCAECGDMDSLHFPMNKFEIGVTAPPFHPMCRCCTAPYFEDDPVSTRMARNPETGKSEYVPNMTYNEWKKTHVDGDDRTDSTQYYRPVTRGDTSEFTYKKGIIINADKITSYPQDVRVSTELAIKPRRLHEIVSTTNKAAQHWGIKQDQVPRIIVTTPDEIPAFGMYDALTNTVFYASDCEIKTYYHEMWHTKQAIDFKESGRKITDRQQYINKLSKICKKHVDSLGITRENVSQISEYARSSYAQERFDEVEAEYMTYRKA